MLSDDIVGIKGWKANGNKIDDKLRMSGFKFHSLDNNSDIIKEDENMLNEINETKNLDLFKNEEN